MNGQEGTLNTDELYKQLLGRIDIPIYFYALVNDRI